MCQMTEPVGNCPRCGEEIFDLNKWRTDGKKHIGCIGSDIDRLNEVIGLRYDNALLIEHVRIAELKLITLQDQLDSEKQNSQNITKVRNEIIAERDALQVRLNAAEVTLAEIRLAVGDYEYVHNKAMTKHK